MNPEQQQNNDPTGENPPATNPNQQPAGQQPINPQPQVVYMARPLEPQQQQISPEMQQQHEESRKKYPFLNLSAGEYVISAIKRHPIGLVYIWTATLLVVLAVIALAALLTSNGALDSLGLSSYGGSSLSMEVVMIPALLVTLLAFIFGFVAAYIYSANRFYLTNESVIQHIQTSLLSKREQTISLANIEDASYTQNGIMPYIFGYGLLRLSTQGDETTYRFNYASSPAKQIAILNNAVENFKNIRPVGRG